MSDPADLGGLIDRLGRAALDARAAIRETHEATQDLRSVLAELRAAMAEARGLADAAGDDATAKVVATVAANVRQLPKSLEGMVDAVILQRTDRLVRTINEGLHQIAVQMGAENAPTIVLHRARDDED